MLLMISFESVIHSMPVTLPTESMKNHRNVIPRLNLYDLFCPTTISNIWQRNEFTKTNVPAVANLCACNECGFFTLQLAVSISRTAKQPRVPMTCWWMILKSTNLDMPQLSRKMELLERLWHFGQLDDKLSMR